MKKAVIFFILLAGHLCVIAQSNVQKAITQIMNEQEHAWNNQDIHGFMEGYLQSDSLQFVTHKGITYGWKNMLHHYLQAYPNPELMGTLTFSQLQFRELSSDYCFVIGKWHISRDAGNIGGLFTLLFKKWDGQWRIVVDHTD